MTCAENIVKQLKETKRRIATAESCTGGMVAAAFTDIAGASDVFDCGVVSYSNDIKAKLLDVPCGILEKYGAVSHQTACAMARGALALSGADIAVSTTGIAGPGGGSADKPVGLVYIGLADSKEVRSFENHFSGTRQQIRQQTVETALKLLEKYLNA